MALTTPSQSPAVSVREIDLTGVVPNVQSSTGAFVGDFNWGPVDQIVRVSNESDLRSKFGTPEKSNAVDFFSAAYFLKYSSSLLVVRVDGGMNAAATSDHQPIELTPAVPATYVVDSDGTQVLDSDGQPIELTPAVPATYAPAARLIKNSDVWDLGVTGSDNTVYAKYPGSLGNSIKVTLIPAGVQSSIFDDAPEAGEVHVIVSDAEGKITGVKGDILETFAFMSTTPGSTNEQGGVNYVTDVIW